MTTGGYSEANMAYRAGQLAQQNATYAARLNPSFGRKIWQLLVCVVGFGILLYGFYLIGRFDHAPMVGASGAPLPTAGIGPRPTYPPVPTPDLGVEPYNATQEARVTTFRATDAAALSTPVPEAPTPTSDPAQFWTAEERAAMTATAEAWYDPATVPTAPPAFVDAAMAGCADPELAAESPYLQLWCPKEEK